MVELHYIEVEIPGLTPEFFVSWFTKVCNHELRELGDLNVIFCSDEYLLEMNRTHLEHDYFTDIITFDYCDGDVVSGDLFISVDRVKENATSFGISFMDELHRVCVHGLLHLCGYGDKSVEEEIIMRTKEDEMLLLR
jgi:probable rRNA maturation factor